MPTKSAVRVYIKTRGRRVSLREMEKFSKAISAIESGSYPIPLKRAMRQAMLEKAFGKRK
jgi:hypothetical protein